MNRTCLLATTPALYTTLAAEISNWVFQRANDGWQVRVLKTSAPTAYDLRAELAAQAPFDHLWMLGPLPQVYVYTAANTHSMGWYPAPSLLVNKDADIDGKRVPGTDRCNLSVVVTPPYAHVAWLNYDGLTGDPGNNLPGLTPAEQIDQYRKWFVRREDRTLFPLVARFNDHLNYSGYSWIGDALALQFADCPSLLKRFTPTYLGDWDDGELRAQTPCLINIVQTGGFPQQALFNYAHWYDVLANPIQSPIASWFGSFMSDVEDPDSLVRMSLVDKTANPKKCKVIAAFNNHYGAFSFKTWLNGGTFGEALTASNVLWIYGMGDPTMTLDFALTERVASLEQKQATMQGDILKLQTTGPAGTGGNPDGGGGTPPGPTVLAWNLGGPTVGAFAGVSGQNFTAPNAASVAGVANAAPAAVYQTGWTGLSFSFVSTNVAPGTYTLLLHGTEPTGSGANSRVQDFTVNGVTIKGVDWYKIAGAANKAAVVSATVVVAADGRLAVSGVSNGPTDRNTWLCAVELRAAAG